MSIHLPVSKADAMTMLDARIPLTYAERKMIVDGLYDLAYQKGIEAERERFKQAMRGAIERVEAIPMMTGEYEDPTRAHRRQLEEKDRKIHELTHNSPGHHAGWDGMTNAERRNIKGASDG